MRELVYKTEFGGEGHSKGILGQGGGYTGDEGGVGILYMKKLSITIMLNHSTSINSMNEAQYFTPQSILLIMGLLRIMLDHFPDETFICTPLIADPSETQIIKRVFKTLIIKRTLAKHRKFPR